MNAGKKPWLALNVQQKKNVHLFGHSDDDYKYLPFFLSEIYSMTYDTAMFIYSTFLNATKTI